MINVYIITLLATSNYMQYCCSLSLFYTSAKAVTFDWTGGLVKLDAGVGGMGGMNECAVIPIRMTFGGFNEEFRDEGGVVVAL